MQLMAQKCDFFEIGGMHDGTSRGSNETCFGDRFYPVLPERMVRNVLSHDVIILGNFYQANRIFLNFRDLSGRKQHHHEGALSAALSGALSRRTISRTIRRTFQGHYQEHFRDVFLC
jgi:hypothetical protein